jgi:hypothetical protein
VVGEGRGAVGACAGRELQIVYLPVGRERKNRGLEDEENGTGVVVYSRTHHSGATTNGSSFHKTWPSEIGSFATSPFPFILSKYFTSMAVVHLATSSPSTSVDDGYTRASRCAASDPGELEGPAGPPPGDVAGSCCVGSEEELLLLFFRTRRRRFSLTVHDGFSESRSAWSLAMPSAGWACLREAAAVVSSPSPGEIDDPGPEVVDMERSRPLVRYQIGAFRRSVRRPSSRANRSIIISYDIVAIRSVQNVVHHCDTQNCVCIIGGLNPSHGKRDLITSVRHVSLATVRVQADRRKGDCSNIGAGLTEGFIFEGWPYTLGSRYRELVSLQFAQHLIDAYRPSRLEPRNSCPIPGGVRTVQKIPRVLMLP